MADELDKLDIITIRELMSILIRKDLNDKIVLSDTKTLYGISRFIESFQEYQSHIIKTDNQDTPRTWVLYINPLTTL